MLILLKYFTDFKEFCAFFENVKPDSLFTSQNKMFFDIVVCEIYHKQNDNWMFDKLPKNVHITSLFEVYICIVRIFSVEVIRTATNELNISEKFKSIRSKPMRNQEPFEAREQEPRNQNHLKLEYKANMN